MKSTRAGIPGWFIWGLILVEVTGLGFVAEQARRALYWHERRKFKMKQARLLDAPEREENQ
jgi:hypothetical protein